MFSGCCGSGPKGVPLKIHFEWVAQKRSALRKSAYHEKGDKYFENCTMDAAYCAQEALETDGGCPNEGKGRGGSKRVHTDASYAWLRKKLKISDS